MHKYAYEASAIFSGGMMSVAFIEIFFVDEAVDELAAFESEEKAVLGFELRCFMKGLPRFSFYRCSDGRQPIHFL